MVGKLNEKKLKKLKFHRLKTWQIILVTILLLFVDATLLRVDHLKMVELRDAVLAADEEEDDELIVERLEELKKFTFSHIVVNMYEENGTQSLTFGTGPFYLEHQYTRAAEEALEEARAELTDYTDQNVMAEVSEGCRVRGENRNMSQYMQCVLSAMEEYPSIDSLTDQITAKIPSTELYRKNYASTIWAPCLSGFMILITLVLLAIIIFRFLAWIFLSIAIVFM